MCEPLPNTSWVRRDDEGGISLSLYLSLVRQIQAVSPYLQQNIDLSERLQELATGLLKRL